MTEKFCENSDDIINDNAFELVQRNLYWIFTTNVWRHQKKGIGQEDKVVSGTLTNILLDQIQTRHPQTRQQSKYKLVIRHEQLHNPIQGINSSESTI